MTYDPDVIIARHMNSDDVICLWSKYGDGLGLSQLAQISKARLQADHQPQTDYWSEKSGTYTQGLNAIKFLIAWALVLFVAEVWFAKRRFAAFMRLLSIAVALLLVGFVFLGLYLYCVEQSAYQQIANLQLLLQDADCRNIVRPAYESQRLERAVRQRWWYLRVEPFQYGEWIVRNLIRGGA